MKSSHGDFVARIGYNYRFITLAEFLVAATLANEYESVVFKNGDNPLGRIKFRHEPGFRRVPPLELSEIRSIFYYLQNTIPKLLLN